jgi:GT2 family glycosyltransferase
VGYFDQNFWPAYFEDADYFRRLELSGVPNLWDERILLEHNRSQTVRADFLLRKLHDERTRRNETYYIRKWGRFAGLGWTGRATRPRTFNHPFNDPNIGCSIPPCGDRGAIRISYDRSEP